MNRKTLVLFGGCFSPPTNAHFSLAQEICDEYEFVDFILFVPVGDFYTKPDLLSARHRVEMLETVCRKNPSFKVSTIETDAEHQPPTIETLDKIQEEYPEYDVWFVIGSDNLRQLPTWERFPELVTKYRPLVIERGADTIKSVLSDVPALLCYKDNIITAKQSIRSDCSSTIIRSFIRVGKSIKYLVPDEVSAYITQNQLFQTESVSRH